MWGLGHTVRTSAVALTLLRLCHRTHSQTKLAGTVVGHRANHALLRPNKALTHSYGASPFWVLTSPKHVRIA